MAKTLKYKTIPTELTVQQFNEFILPLLTTGSRGPEPKLSSYGLFQDILYLLHSGCQWTKLPIDKDENEKPEAHYTTVYRAFRRWESDGCFDTIFDGAVFRLSHDGLFDVSVMHGDGTTTGAKKGGDNVGFSGHKKK